MANRSNTSDIEKKHVEAIRVSAEECGLDIEKIKHRSLHG